MEMKAINPILTKNEIAKKLGYSSDTVKRFRNDIKMPLFYRIQSNTNKKKQKTPNEISKNKHEPKVNPIESKRAQKDHPKSETIPKPDKRNKNTLNSGSIQKNFEINNQNLDEILHNNNSYMELAKQLISNDQTVRGVTIQYLKDFKSQSLTKQAIKREQLVSMMPAIKKAFDLWGDDIVELFTENDALKNRIGSYDEKWLEQSRAKDR